LEPTCTLAKPIVYFCPDQPSTIQPGIIIAESDFTTTANYLNSSLAREDDMSRFNKWVSRKPDVEQPIKDVVSSMVSAYRREQSKTEKTCTSAL
jgi:hypothetical protein